MKLKIEAASGIGSREFQEDTFVVGKWPIESLPIQTVPPFFLDTSNKAPVLTAVLDGVGSCSYAALGSAIAGSKIQSAFYAEEAWFSGESGSPDLVEQKLKNACMDACGKLSLLNRSFGGSIEAATTITAAAFSERQLHLWALGDSPPICTETMSFTHSSSPCVKATGFSPSPAAPIQILPPAPTTSRLEIRSPFLPME